MFFFAFLLLVTKVIGEVTVLKVTQYVYDKSPKLRIRGSGFNIDEHDITLELGANGQPPLVADKDYLLTKDADGLILKLLGNRCWADLSSRVPPVALVLSSIKFKGSNKNLVPDPILVAQILNTPTVRESSQTIYQTATNELRINGIGFIGSKAVNFYFQPPLVKEVAYEDVTQYPLRRDEIVLRLRHGYSWREVPGPLRILGVDTGGGPVQVRGEEGVLIGNVQPNIDFHSIRVEATVNQQLVYADAPNLIITGSGFNPVGNTLRFSNGLLGNGVNYTTVSNSDTSISIRLVPGSYWRRNFDNLPGPLTLLAVNAGEGFVAVGPTNSGKGRDIAMVFERPIVYSDHKTIYKTQSHEFHIKGSGFPELSSSFKPMLKFSPPLTEGVDYTLRVVDRTDLEVTLLDGRAWRAQPGSLRVIAINTRGDDGGWIKFEGEGVHIAEVVKDVGREEAGGVEVLPLSMKVYQSALQQKVDIIGKGFRSGVSFVFDPPLESGKDYEVDSLNDYKVTLKLRPGKKWRSDPGFIVVKSIKVDGKEYSIASGIRVAIVLADPVITPSKQTMHESQSKIVVISGSGFTNAADTKIAIRPTSSSSFKIVGIWENAIRLQLNRGMAWLPSYISLKGEDEGKQIDLQVVSIDTGAGTIVFDEVITVGRIIKDREGVTCDDTCVFSFNGICDVLHYNGLPSRCQPNTDCTDCGGPDAITLPRFSPSPQLSWDPSNQRISSTFAPSKSPASRNLPILRKFTSPPTSNNLSPPSSHISLFGPVFLTVLFVFLVIVMLLLFINRKTFLVGVVKLAECGLFLMRYMNNDKKKKRIRLVLESEEGNGESDDEEDPGTELTPLTSQNDRERGQQRFSPSMNQRKTSTRILNQDDLKEIQSAMNELNKDKYKEIMENGENRETLFRLMKGNADIAQEFLLYPENYRLSYLKNLLNERTK